MKHHQNKPHLEPQCYSPLSDTDLEQVQGGVRPSRPFRFRSLPLMIVIRHQKGWTSFPRGMKGAAEEFKAATEFLLSGEEADTLNERLWKKEEEILLSTPHINILKSRPWGNFNPFYAMEFFN